MRNGDEDNQSRTVFCGNLSEEVTDSILFELFYQAGPVESIRRPKDPNGRPKSFGFIVFKHECSVPFATEIFRNTKLFNRNINVNTRNTNLYHIPVLDTHLTEFTGPQENRNESRRSQNREEDHRNERSRRSEGSSQRQHSKDEQDQNKASSWAELKNDALRGNGILSSGLDRDDLRNTSFQRGHSRENVTHPMMNDFNALLQMGQQMVIPGMVGLPGITNVHHMMPLMGLGPSLGSNMFPSMQGMMSGGERRHSPPRERGQRNYHEGRERRDHHEDREDYRGRESRRVHPYDDRHHNHWEDHKRHDRGYSSSRSSHERERRDRRSR